IPFKWLKVWFPTECPSAIILLKISGCFFIFSPMQKKVTFALCFFNSSKTQGVTSGIGPSSKVRYTALVEAGNAQILSGYNRWMNLGIFTKWNFNLFNLLAFPLPHFEWAVLPFFSEGLNPKEFQWGYQC